MTPQTLVDDIARLGLSREIEVAVSLKQYCTYQIGGPADYLARP